ncbi:nitrogenase iron-molybdenum cofactor biosynthesis protein NifB [Clostridium pasteurianum DSM 525 = ATCC 6013]|uniref:Dinitrogenase iron-molybdenum cofactor biosynthesis protein n=1 Tax=Clostridium pasteurianum DSM 525 = ATCC 6013 TaxID=1262449 RepID=A0A0H3IZE4_CLOPA|nr:nitrogenase iron-molybdenum cofactor biosynthesis protein NifB [Clostridium pasteurianum]AJA46399.1 nitrogenase iron-molybdenum cofactor biosynthesis protein NifB [Clostridium pasteurianum DSM 525 = ATCC 6013]AJA50387.1 nitrogenase iron-molybdenum cofactor biosynthesis protein NifB [Clostridium pasteurianum DSM 525 = ATCC 6013]AOZ73836.1 dinitrogenase iron-molybdenum cofactor biosynthesis protein [Clostridium pasteurianum DSM 525 = ATCC 6013]AOZ77633.1 dinitrogenase iron-molybdenum cofactor 
MSIKIAVGSSDGKIIDQHFGSGNKFYIFEVFEDGTNQYLENFDIKEEDIINASKKYNSKKVRSLDGARSGSFVGGCGSSSQSSCGSSQSSCGGGSCSGGQDDSQLIGKISLLSKYDAVLVNKIGNRAEKLLVFSGLHAFENDGTIEEALPKLYTYLKRTKAI